MISCVGFTDVILLGLEDENLLGRNVAEDGINDGNIVGTLDLCIDGGNEKVTVGAMVADIVGVIGDVKKLSYKYTLPLELSTLSSLIAAVDPSAVMSKDHPKENPPVSPIIVSPTIS